MENNTFVQQNAQQIKDITLEGVAFISENINLFSFAPDDPVPGRVKGFRRRGTAQQMTDGTFDFVAKPDTRSQASLIKKLAHGRASETVDGAIQLTLKVFKNEGLNISDTILHEAIQGSEAIEEYLSHSTPQLPQLLNSSTPNS